MLLRALEVASLVSAGLTVILVLVARFAWRRRKPLQEP
jgi:cytochrome b561